jgi:hypothetical protein
VRELAVDRHGLEGWIAIQQMTGVVARRHTPDGRSQHVPAERTDDPLAQCSWPSTTRIFAMRPCRWRFARASVPKRGPRQQGTNAIYARSGDWLARSGNCRRCRGRIRSLRSFGARCARRPIDMRRRTKPPTQEEATMKESVSLVGCRWLPFWRARRHGPES